MPMSSSATSHSTWRVCNNAAFIILGTWGTYTFGAKFVPSGLFAGLLALVIASFGAEALYSGCIDAKYGIIVSRQTHPLWYWFFVTLNALIVLWLITRIFAAAHA
jgi:hypothetical protein